MMFPTDVTWNITKQNGKMIASGDSGTTPYALYTEKICISNGDYSFAIYDLFSDGICCNNGEGYYSLFVEDILVGKGGEFQSVDKFDFTVSDEMTPFPTSAPTVCPSQQVAIHLTTDLYPGDTSWVITKASNNAEIMTKTFYSEENTFYVDEMCLPIDSYLFTIKDAYGDGICCAVGEGEYKLIVGDRIIKEGGKFNLDETTKFTVADRQCKRFMLKLKTDKFGQDIMVVLAGANRDVIFIGGPYESSQSFVEEACLSDGEYSFTIFDKYGDGIRGKNGKGSYILFLDGKRLKSGGSFDFAEKTDFEVGGKTCYSKGKTCSKNKECCSKKCKNKTCK